VARLPNAAVRRFAAVTILSWAIKFAAVALLLVLAVRSFGGP
jgi:hypothetical protein